MKNEGFSNIKIRADGLINAQYNLYKINGINFKTTIDDFLIEDITHPEQQSWDYETKHVVNL